MSRTRDIGRLLGLLVLIHITSRDLLWVTVYQLTMVLLAYAVNTHTDCALLRARC
jgi:hypothetical protein